MEMDVAKRGQFVIPPSSPDVARMWWVLFCFIFFVVCGGLRWPFKWSVAIAFLSPLTPVSPTQIWTWVGAGNGNKKARGKIAGVAHPMDTWNKKKGELSEGESIPAPKAKWEGHGPNKQIGGRMKIKCVFWWMVDELGFVFFYFVLFALWGAKEEEASSLLHAPLRAKQ